MNRITQYTTLYVWLLSLSLTLPRLTHSGVRTLLPLNGSTVSHCVCPICWSVHGHFGLFLPLAVVNSAAVSIRVYLFGYQDGFLGTYWGVESLAHAVIPCLIYWGTSKHAWTILLSYLQRVLLPPHPDMSQLFTFRSKVAPVPSALLRITYDLISELSASRPRFFLRDGSRVPRSVGTCFARGRRGSWSSAHGSIVGVLWG